MIENDPKKTADDELDEDDEFESLSQDEKAAFEKIMAEIAEAEAGGSPTSASSSSPAEAPDTQSASASTKDATPAASAPDVQESSKEDTQQASAPQTESDNPDATLENPTAEDRDADEDLDEDQQAALDAIMAQIEGAKGVDNSASQEEPIPEASPVSETSSPSPEESSSEADADEDLDEDQQAALNAIMAEIEGKKSVDKSASEEKPSIEEEPVSETEPLSEAEDDEDLSEDQQAALNAIMAEIEGKKSIDKSDSEEKPSIEEEPVSETEPLSEAEDDEDLSEDQQAALDAIMAEIEDKRKTDTPPTEKIESAVEENDSKQGLSMEEFNNELSSLLNADEDSNSDAADEIENRVETVEDKGGSTDDTPLQQPEEVNDAQTNDEKSTPTDFPILKEVSVDDEEAPKPSKQDRTPRHRSTPLKKIAIVSVALVAVLGVVWFGYHAIPKFWMRPSSTFLLETQTSQTPPPSDRTIVRRFCGNTPENGSTGS